MKKNFQINRIYSEDEHQPDTYNVVMMRDNIYARKKDDEVFVRKLSFLTTQVPVVGDTVSSPSRGLFTIKNVVEVNDVSGQYRAFGNPGNYVTVAV